METIGFRVSAELAMFRKWYTTTSSVSYHFPPPTSIVGMIGAMIGIPKESLWKTFEGDIAIVIDNPIKVIQQGVNYINTKENKNNSFRIRVLHHYLYNPSYLIFYRGPLAPKIRTFLRERKSIYPLYMGQAYNLSVIEPIIVQEQQELDGDYASSTVVNYIDKINWEKNNHVFIEKMDTRMDSNRVPIMSRPIAYSFNVKTGSSLNIWFTEKQSLTYLKISLSRITGAGEKELWLDWIKI
jgi:CRISPR-associated protein Cas5h